MITKKENNFLLLLRKILYRADKVIPFRGPVSFLYLNCGLPIQVGFLKFFHFYRFINESQWWPKQKLQEYQAQKMKLLLRYAYRHVPYYSEIFKKNNLHPDDFHSVEDLRKLPILTKEDVMLNSDKLVSRNASRKYFERRFTSGSSGKPMYFYYDKRLDYMEFALERRHHDWMKIRMHERRVALWARPFIVNRIKDIYFYEPLMGRLSLSAVNPGTESGLMDKYIKIMKKFKPLSVSGNPSFLYYLAHHCLENNITDIRFRAFFSLFENLMPYQREAISRCFNCEIFNCYTSQERVLHAVECSRHEGMHIEMEEGILEIVGEDRQVLPDGEQGRMVATGLHNYVMPFIRYDTGDIGAISKAPCSCGRGLSLLRSLDGRANEAIRYKGKVLYSATLSFVLCNLKNIKECQFIQRSEDEVEVNVVRSGGYSEKDTQGIIKALKDTVDVRLNIAIRFVDYIPRNKMGKFPFIISTVGH